MAKQIEKKFIGNDQVDSTKILLEQSQAIRAKDSAGVEQELIKLGASDEVLVKGSQVSLKADLDAEVAGFNNALGVTNAAIAQEVLDRQGAVTALEDAIDQEISDRQAADALKADLAGATFTGDVTVPNLYASGSANIGYFGGEFNSLSVKTIQSSDAADLQINSTASKVTISAGNDYARNAAPGTVAKDIMLNPTSGEVDVTFSKLKNVVAGSGYNDAVIKGQLDSVETSLQGQIDALSGSSGSSLSALEGEINNIEASVGLNTNGDLGAWGGSASIDLGAAMTVKGGIVVVDGRVTQEISDRQAAVSVEEAARIAADANLQSQISSVISNVDPAALDSLTEIVTAFQAADASLNGAITALSTGLSADIAAEEAARIAADSALDGRLDSLEAVVWIKQKFSITAGQTSVTLSFTPKANSLSAFVDRLAIHEGAGEDYTISGTTLTFLNPGNGNGQIGNGDTVYVKYQK